MATAQELAAQGVVVGMKALTGDVQPRVDIDTLLIEKPDTFNLMLQALAVMQDTPNLLGYYSIAGIHGFPSTSWDGVSNQFNARGAKFGGYCPHGRMIFPTWHRPFLMLLEQTIYQNMVVIARKYEQPHRDRYEKAAKAFRLPYLDYFRARDDRGVKWPGPREDQWHKYDFRLPDIFNEPRINVKLAPLDTIQEIDNPLYAYRFKTETGQLPPDDWKTVSLSQLSQLCSRSRPLTLCNRQTRGKAPNSPPHRPSAGPRRRPKPNMTWWRSASRSTEPDRPPSPPSST
jgi:tyrosinase